MNGRHLVVLTLIALVSPSALADEPLADSAKNTAGRDRVAGLLIGALRSEDVRTRTRCAFLLGQLGQPHASGPLAAALGDPEREVRLWAGISLAWLDDARGLGAARAALVGPPWWTRLYAAVALGRLGGERTRVALEQAARDPDPLVAEAVAGILGGQPPSRYVPELAVWALEGETATDVIDRGAEALVAEADAWFHEGNYPQCLRCQDAALLLDPGWANLYGVNGWLYWSLGRNVEALGAYKRGVWACPDSWDTHQSLAFHYLNVLQDCDKAAWHYGRARQLGCPTGMAHMQAHALEKGGHLQEALAVWREFAAEDPADPISRHHISRLEALIGG